MHDCNIIIQVNVRDYNLILHVGVRLYQRPETEADRRQATPQRYIYRVSRIFFCSGACCSRLRAIIVFFQHLTIQ